jgi:DNA repair protein RecO (recombination protein O)
LLLSYFYYFCKNNKIVFRVVKYGETSVICDIFTEERGLQSYIINSVRSKKPKFHGGLLQVMSLVELVAYSKNEKTLNHIKELKSALPYQTIPFQIVKSSVGLFMAELAQKTVKESEQNLTLFAFLYQSFVYLDVTPYSVANLHLWFSVQLTSFLGCMPDSQEEEQADFFDLKDGNYAKYPPAHGHFMGMEQSKVLSLFLNSSIEECHQITLTTLQRREFAKNIIKYYQLHVENFVELKTFTVLQEVM